MLVCWAKSGVMACLLVVVLLLHTTKGSPQEAGRQAAPFRSAHAAPPKGPSQQAASPPAAATPVSKAPRSPSIPRLTRGMVGWWIRQTPSSRPLKGAKAQRTHACTALRLLPGWPPVPLRAQPPPAPESTTALDQSHKKGKDGAERASQARALAWASNRSPHDTTAHAAARFRAAHAKRGCGYARKTALLARPPRRTHSIRGRKTGCCLCVPCSEGGA